MEHHFLPYSHNIIFFDTEFSSLDPYIGEILSIGLVKINGEELYLELKYDGPIDEWVLQNIIPTLTETKYPREMVIQRINDFIADSNPYLIAFVNQYDSIYLYKLFNQIKKPFHWLPIDFASILFSLRIDPETYMPDNSNCFLRNIGIDLSKYHQHNSLDDAKLLRDVYLKLTDYSNK